MANRFRSAFLEVDPRSLGLFRIALALVLLGDWCERLRHLEWYTNDGPLPNHTLLWQPFLGHSFSLFFVASSRSEAVAGFALCSIAYLLLLFGVKTRWALVGATICRLSLSNRLAPVEMGSDMVLNLLCVYSLVLPLGARLSLDSLAARLRRRPERSAEKLNERTRWSARSDPVHSVAVLGLLLQFAAIYTLNAVTKNGASWVEGSSVHYALHADTIVTSFGVWMRETLPYGVLRLLSHGTLVVEWAAPLLLLCPVWLRWTRLLAVLLLPALHMGFELALDLGFFSWGMSAFYPLLLRAEHWRWMSRQLGARRRATVVVFDETNDMVTKSARVLTCLDAFGRLQWRDGYRGEQGWYVESNRKLMGERAVVSTLSALPLSGLWLPPARALRLTRLLERLHTWGADSASPIARQLRRYHPRHSAPRAGALHRWTRFRARRVPGLLMALFMVCVWGEIVNNNQPFPAWMRFDRPEWMKAAVMYPRVLQGWRMYAPTVPDLDANVCVRAITTGGRTVDPFNEAASRTSCDGSGVVPQRLGQSQFFSLYAERIPHGSWESYRGAFAEWILRYPQRTGRPDDEIVRFEAYLLRDRSPPPGQTQPRPLDMVAFMTYP